MKIVHMKKLVLAAAIAGVCNWNFSANAENTVNLNPANRDSMENRATSRDNNITNPNIEGYKAPDSTPVVESANIDHEGVVHFQPNSVTLSQQAEGQLKQLVEQLDKDKPVALTVTMQEGYETQSHQPQSAEGSKDSSAGYPAEGEGMAGRSKSTAAGGEQENRAELIARYRMENIRLYLQEKGIEVVEWNIEGQPSNFSGKQLPEDSGLTGRDNSQASQSSEISDVQQVRVVVIGEVQPNGLSTL